MKKSLGILVTNTGTPDSPSVSDVRRYLKSFLSDPRVVRLPRLLWLPLLELVILPRRARYSAELYQNIWTSDGSPLRTIMTALTTKLESHLATKFNHPVFVETGMHYGNPSIPNALNKLQAKNIEELLVLPLFPQYSTSTTEATKDQVNRCLKKHPTLKPRFIAHYADHPSYIEALVQQIKAHHQPQHYLLFSFHGLPQRFIEQGDPYADHCHKTASAVAQVLDIPENRWSITYQSRFGYAQWLAPYTFEMLKELPQKGIQELSIVCPGFSIDCLETLEEIQLRGKEVFLKHGGKVFNYIPALNASNQHVKALGELISHHLAVY